MRQINEYIEDVFHQEDPELEAVLTSIREAGMRPLSVSPSAGKLLTMLVRMNGSRNILEIGALGGYSGICLARGLGPEGRLTSLELRAENAELSARNLENAGFISQTTFKVGSATDSLGELIEAGERFDFFFIDADKENYGHYLDACITLAEKNAIIICDNVLTGGQTKGGRPASANPTEFMKQFNRKVANHPALESTLVPIGDGLTISRVIGDK